MKTKTLVRALPFILGFGLLVSCGKKEEVMQSETNVAVKVTTATATSQPIAETATYTANVQAEVINQITPTVPGRIDQIYVEVGQRVSKGQVLARMESNNLDQQMVQLTNLKRDYDRYSELLKVGGIAQQQVDQLKTQIDVLQRAIDNLNDNTTLRSPINGVVTARNYDNGNVFGQLPILTVEELNPLKAIIYVSESYFTKVQTGMITDIRLDVYGDEVFQGKVALVYPVVDASTHTFGVEVAIQNTGARVRPGMYARVTLNFGEHQSVVIPDVAVQKQAGSNDKYIYIVEDGTARYRKVELGQRKDDQYEILSGIIAGDVVVTAGQNRLIDGSSVEIIQE